MFYYNTKTRESVWDHPYDSFYKAAILKYKTGECTKSELTELVSQPWLLSDTDERLSSRPEMSPGPSPRLRISISEVPSDLSPSSLQGGRSPTRMRRRMSERKSSSTGPQRSPAASPGSYSSRYAERASPSEVEALKAKLAEALAASEALRKDVLAETDKVANQKVEMKEMVQDLIKAKEYIEVLMGENKALRNRMGEALVRANQIKDRWTMEIYRRENAEQQVTELQNRVHDLELSPPDTPFLARLCGCSSKKNPNGFPTKQLLPVEAAKPTAIVDSDPFAEITTLLSPNFP